MKIQVLGTGCSRCKHLYDNVKAAVAGAGVEAEVEKVEDIVAILRYGVLSTPALVVDGVIRASGTVLPVEAIRKMIS